MSYLSTPIDYAYEHCLWAKRAGLTPHDVVEAVECVGYLGNAPLDWLNAAVIVRNYVHRNRLSTTTRAAA